MRLHKTTESRVHDIGLSVQAGHRWVGMWETYFNITKAGGYEFSVRQDDQASSALFIDSHPVIEDLCQDSSTGRIEMLDRGPHNLKLLLYGGGWEDTIELSYKGPDTNSYAQIVPASIFLPGVMCAAPCIAPPTPPAPCNNSLLEEASEGGASGRLAGSDAIASEDGVATGSQAMDSGRTSGGDESGAASRRKVYRMEEDPDQLISVESDVQQRRWHHRRHVPANRHGGELFPSD